MAGTARRAVIPLEFVVLLASLAAIGPLSSYFLGLALGQLVFGPLIDRVGRRPPLLAGMVLYAIASVGWALAPTIGTLMAMRFFQALGACSGMVVAPLVGSTLHAIARLLPETLAEPSGPLQVGPLARQYLDLLRNRVFLGYAVAGGVAQAGMFAYIASSSFVLLQVYELSATLHTRTSRSWIGPCPPMRSRGWP